MVTMMPKIWHLFSEIRYLHLESPWALGFVRLLSWLSCQGQRVWPALSHCSCPENLAQYLHGWCGSTSATFNLGMSAETQFPRSLHLLSVLKTTKWIRRVYCEIFHTWGIWVEKKRPLLKLHNNCARCQGGYSAAINWIDSEIRKCPYVVLEYRYCNKYWLKS